MNKIPEHKQKILNHLISCMNKFDFGSQEYELARKAFAFLANQIRSQEKDE